MFISAFFAIILDHIRGRDICAIFKFLKVASKIFDSLLDFVSFAVCNFTFLLSLFYFRISYQSKLSDLVAV